MRGVDDGETPLVSRADHPLSSECEGHDHRTDASLWPSDRYRAWSTLPFWEVYHAPGIYNARLTAGVSAYGRSGLGAQRVIDALPDPITRPLSAVAGRRLSVRQFGRQHASGHAAPRDGEDGVNDIPVIDGCWTSTWFWRGNQWVEDGLFSVPGVARVVSVPSHNKQYAEFGAPLSNRFPDRL